MNSRMLALRKLAQELGIEIVIFGMEDAGLRPNMMLLDELDEIQKVPRTRVFEKSKRTQNNDWRKSRGFNGYHREF